MRARERKLLTPPSMPYTRKSYPSLPLVSPFQVYFFKEVWLFHFDSPRRHLDFYVPTDGHGLFEAVVNLTIEQRVALTSVIGDPEAFPPEHLQQETETLFSGMTFSVVTLMHPDLHQEFVVFYFGHALYFRFHSPFHNFDFWINISCPDAAQALIELCDVQKEALFKYSDSLRR